MLKSWLAENVLSPWPASPADADWGKAWEAGAAWAYTAALLAANTAVWLFVWLLARSLLAGAEHALLRSVAVRALAVTAAVVLFWRVLQQRSWEALGLRPARPAWMDVLAGLFIMAAAQTVMWLVLLAAGAVHIRWVAGEGAHAFKILGEAMLLWALVAWSEELLVRGYWLNTVAAGHWLAGVRRTRALTTPRPGAADRLAGALVSSAFFVVLHAANAHISAPALVGIFVGGMFLAYAYVCSDALWLPMGMHLGWNLFEGSVYGLRVSGVEAPRLWATSLAGPSWLTGGAFGPEASMAAVPALVLAFGLIAVYTSWGYNGNQKKRCAARLKDSFVSLAAMIGFVRV